MARFMMIVALAWYYSVCLCTRFCAASLEEKGIRSVSEEKAQPNQMPWAPVTTTNPMRPAAGGELQLWSGLHVRTATACKTATALATTALGVPCSDSSCKKDLTCDDFLEAAANSTLPGGCKLLSENGNHGRTYVCGGSVVIKRASPGCEAELKDEKQSLKVTASLPCVPRLIDYDFLTLPSCLAMERVPGRTVSDSVNDIRAKYGLYDPDAENLKVYEADNQLIRDAITAASKVLVGHDNNDENVLVLGPRRTQRWTECPIVFIDMPQWSWKSGASKPRWAKSDFYCNCNMIQTAFSKFSWPGSGHDRAPIETKGLDCDREKNAWENNRKDLMIRYKQQDPEMYEDAFDKWLASRQNITNICVKDL